MNALKRKVLVMLLLACTSSAASAAQVGDFVFPATLPGYLKVDQREVAQADITHFLEVLQVRGNWLWVERREIADPSAPGPTGWVRRDEVDSFDEHVEAVESWVRENASNDPTAYFVLGLICRLSDHPEQVREAVSYFSRAIQLSPASDVYYHERALCWIRLGHYENALADFEEALLLDPNYGPYQEGVAVLRDAVREQQLEREPAPPAVVEDAPEVPGDENDDAVSSLLRDATESDS